MSEEVKENEKLTDEQKHFNSWKEDPITQMFFQWLMYRKYDINFYRLGLLSNNLSQQDLTALAVANGQYMMVSSIQDLDADVLRSELEVLQANHDNVRKAFKSDLGVF